MELGVLGATAHMLGRSDQGKSQTLSTEVHHRDGKIGNSERYQEMRENKKVQCNCHRERATLRGSRNNCRVPELVRAMGPQLREIHVKPQTGPIIPNPNPDRMQ